MKTVVIVDDTLSLPVIRPYLVAQKQAFLVITDRKIADQLTEEPDIKIIVMQNIAEQDLFWELALCDEDRIIVCVRNVQTLHQCIRSIRSFSKDIAVAVIGKTHDEVKDIDSVKDVFYISLEDVIAQRLMSIWQTIENNKRITRMKDISRDAQDILILIQNDPDPDAIASGLALRALLGRNKQTAPIGSFGEVTRNENLNMIELLDIPVMKVTPDDLSHFSKIALVDVQPPYFKNCTIKADIVIDHHPVSEPYEAPYADIRVSYGATSTILGEYFIDGNYKITQRLATALTYGIKTDTMFLDRDINQADIKVFTFLYPMANLNMIRQIESATLAYDEISGFIKALKNVKIVEKMIFAYIGQVDKEDLIPRLADFCLQIGRAEWSFVTGIFNNSIICCVRNVGYVKHAGDLVRRAFGNIGSAGGHRSMAKAVIPARKFKNYFKVTGRKGIEEQIITILLNAKE